MVNQRNQRRGRRQPPRRNNNRTNRSNRPARASRTGALTSTRADLQTHSRVFTRDVIIYLNQNLAGTTLYRNWMLDDYLQRYDGTELLLGCFDQYKINRLEVFCRASLSNCAVQSDTVSSIQSALHGTTVTSVIDLDSTTPITGDFALSYTNAKTKAVGRNWTRIANYIPRIESTNVGQIATAPMPLWLDTQNPTVNHIGLQAQFANEAGTEFFGTSSTTSQKVAIRVRAHVTFRGRRSDPQATGVSLFFAGIIGATVTPLTGPVRTVTDFQVTPGGLTQFQFNSVPVWRPISELVYIAQNGENPAGVPLTYSGPMIPSNIPQ